MLLALLVGSALQQAEGQLSHPGQVLRAVSGPVALFILAEADVQHPSEASARSPNGPRTQLRYCSAVAAALPMKYRISLLETPLTTR